MSGIFKTLFGGSDASTSSQSTSTPQNYTNPILQGLANPLSSSLSQLIQSLTSTTNNANANGGVTPVPQAPLTGQEGNLLNTIQGQVGPGTASASWIKNVLGGQYLPGSPGGNPELSAAITAAQRPTLDNLTQTLTQALPGRFAAAGQQLQPNSPGSEGGGSSAFDNAAALAFNSAAHTSTDIASNIANNAWNVGTQQQTAAAGLDQNEVHNTIDALQATALPRLIQQNGINQGLQLFQTQVSNLLDVLKTIGAVQAPTLANTSQSTSQGTSSTEKSIIPDLFPKGI